MPRFLPTTSEETMINIRARILSMTLPPSLQWLFRPVLLLKVVRPLALLIGCCWWIEAQQLQAPALLAKAVHFADLYNWADAAPAFTEAETLFAAAGDQRNALYARLGRIRS